jgi:hypothetical protein
MRKENGMAHFDQPDRKTREAIDVRALAGAGGGRQKAGTPLLRTFEEWLARDGACVKKAYFLIISIMENGHMLKK